MRLVIKPNIELFGFELRVKLSYELLVVRVSGDMVICSLFATHLIIRSSNYLPDWPALL